MLLPVGIFVCDHSVYVDVLNTLENVSFDEGTAFFKLCDKLLDLGSLASLLGTKRRIKK